jgi:hypothetical protein
MDRRPTFSATFVAAPGMTEAEALRSFRALLKTALRRFKFHAVDARQHHAQEPKPQPGVKQ